MDVVKQKPKNRRSPYLILGGLCFVVLLVFLWFQPRASESVEQESLLIDAVRMGDLEVVVNGYGKLRSNRQTMLTTRDSATVKEIVLRPGAEVAIGSTIVILNNPELERRVTDSKAKWRQQISLARQTKLNNDREYLAAEAALQEVSSEYAVVGQKFEAYAELVKRGVISALQYKEAELNRSQLESKQAIEKKRLTQLQQLHIESQKVQQDLIAQAESQYQADVQRLDALNVRSPVKGILQRLPLELGQSLAVGGQLALIGTVDDLLALIDVPQREVNQVKNGQSANIVLDGETIAGVVQRVDPAVKDNGMVVVEIRLSGEVPASARPELTVDASIITESLSDVFFIQRPSVAVEHQKGYLYKVESEKSLTHTSLNFGSVAGRYIQIKSGAKAGDQFVISKMTEFGQLEHVAIR